VSGALDFDPWAALECENREAVPPNPSKAPNRQPTLASGLGGLGALGEGAEQKRDSDTLARDTLARVRTGLAGYPADAVEATEREALMGEAKLPLAPADEYRAMVAGLPRAARGEPEPRELATLSPNCTEAVTAGPDGRIGLRRRPPDGQWSAPTLLRLAVERGKAA